MGDEIEFMGVLLEVLHYFVRPLVFLAVMVFGFIILFCKTKSTRILGVSFILSSAIIIYILTSNKFSSLLLSESFM